MINIGVTLTLILSLTILLSILSRCKKSYLCPAFTATFTFTVFISTKRKLNMCFCQEKIADDLEEDLSAEDLIEMETLQTLLKQSKWSSSTMMRTSKSPLMSKLEDQYLLYGLKNQILSGNQRSRSVLIQLSMKKLQNFIWLNKSTSTKMSSVST